MITENISLLTEVSLFNGVSEEGIKSVLSCLLAHVKSYSKGEFILSAGNEAGDIGILLSGAASVIKEDFWGNRSILAKLSPTDIFAESFSFAGIKKLPVSVVADSASDVLFIDCHRLVHTCSSPCEFHQRIIFNMVRIMALKNVFLTVKIEHISCRTTRDKILSFLSSQAALHGSREFELEFNRQEMADYLTVDRSALSRELCKLREEKILEFNKNKFKLL